MIIIILCLIPVLVLAAHIVKKEIKEEYIAYTLENGSIYDGRIVEYNGKIYIEQMKEINDTATRVGFVGLKKFSPYRAEKTLFAEDVIAYLLCANLYEYEHEKDVVGLWDEGPHGYCYKEEYFQTDDRIQSIMENSSFYIDPDSSKEESNKEILGKYVEELEKTFKDSTYIAEDFFTMKKQYFLRFDNPEHDYKIGPIDSSFMAVIFFDGNDYYFINHNNKIDGEVAEELHRVLGE